MISTSYPQHFWIIQRFHSAEGASTPSGLRVKARFARLHIFISQHWTGRRGVSG